MRTLFTLILALAVTASLPAAHGGTYVPPGDIVPPGGPPPSTTPQPPNGPVTPPTGTPPNGPVTPPGATDPNRPHTPPNVPPGQQRRGVTGGGALPPDDTWSRWWEFNQDAYLRLRAEVFGRGVTTPLESALSGLGRGAESGFAHAPTRGDRERVALALLAAAAREQDDDLHSAVLIATAKLGVAHEEARAFALQALRSGSQEIQETAALALGLQRDAAAAEVLLAVLEDQAAGRAATGGAEVRGRTRVFAAYALGLLADAAPELREPVAAGLVRTLERSAGAQQELRVACVLALGLAGVDQPERWAPPLIAGLFDEREDALVQAHYPRALGRVVAQLPAGAELRGQALDALLKASGHDVAQVRVGAVQALGHLGAAAAPDVNRRIFLALENTADAGRSPQERQFALLGLAFLGADDGGGIRDEVELLLAQRAKRGNAATRPWAALGLGLLQFHLEERDGRGITAESRRILRDGYADEKETDRKGAYAIALGLAKDVAAADLLGRTFAAEDDEVLQGYTAVALGMLDARVHASLLGARLAETKRRPWLLRHVAIGLALMGDGDVRVELLALVAPPDGSRARLATLSAATTGLGLVGDRATLAPLLTALEDLRYAPLGRAFAAVALGMVCDQELLPWSSRYSQGMNYHASVETLTSPLGKGLLDVY